MRGAVVFLALLPTSLVFPSLKIGRTQSAAVKGVLICNGKPAANVNVKLYNGCRGTGSDDPMDDETTDSEGRFLLEGRETEIITIDPRLDVYHDCNDENTPRVKKFSIMIPDSFVSDGPEPKKTFDVGTLNLSGEFSSEKQDCGS